MSTIIPIENGQTGLEVRTLINTNTENLNTDKLEVTDVSEVAISGLMEDLTNVQAPVSPTGAALNYLDGDWRSRKDRVLVESILDLPTPVGGLIQLEDSVDYRIRGSVDISLNRFSLGVANSITGVDYTKDKIISSTPGDLITGQSKDLTVENVQFVAPTARIFNLDKVANSPTDFMFISMRNFQILSCREFGRVKDANVFALDGINFFTQATDKGWTLEGTNCDIFIYNGCFTFSCNNELLDFGTSLWSKITVSNSDTGNDTGSVFLSGQPNGANLRSTGEAFVFNNSFRREPPVVNNITEGDTGWQFSSNKQLPSSKIVGDIGFSNNTLPTVIPTADTYTDITGIGSFEGQAQRVNIINSNQAQIGGRLTKSSVIASGSLSLTKSGPARTYTVAIFRDNGVTDELVSREFTLEVKNTPVFVNVTTDIVVDTGDIISLKVKTEAGFTDSVTAVGGVLIIRAESL